MINPWRSVSKVQTPLSIRRRTRIWDWALPERRASLSPVPKLLTACDAGVTMIIGAARTSSPLLGILVCKVQKIGTIISEKDKRCTLLV